MSDDLSTRFAQLQQKLVDHWNVIATMSDVEHATRRCPVHLNGIQNPADRGLIERWRT